MKRLLSALVVLLLIAAACSGDSDSESSGADIDAPAEDADDVGEDSGDAGSDDDASDTDASDGTPQPGGEITYGLADAGTGFDTTSAITPGSYRIVNALVDPLVSMGPDGLWQPDLAASLTPNEDSTVWTITLREGIAFHDGEPLDAVAVKANMEAYKASTSVGFAFNDVTSVEVIDDLTVDVVMGRPWAAFPFILTGQPGWMVSPSSIGNNESFVGTGPFVLESWTPGDSAKVVRNPDYWRADEGLPHLDAITFKVIPEATTRRQALEAGDIQAYAEPGSANMADLAESGAVDLNTSAGGGNEFLVLLNTTKPPFDDIRVRTAMATAIDRQLLIDNFRGGLTVPADSLISPDSRFWVGNGYPEFDLSAAGALIAEYEAEVGDVSVSLTHADTTPTDVIAEVIASFWQDAGIDVSLDPIGAEAAVGRALSDDFGAMTWIQFGAPDPDIEYVFFHSSMGLLNWTNMVDADLDAALDLGREALDEETRAEAYGQLQRLLVEKMPIVWIDHLQSVEAVATIPSLKGFADSTFVDGSERLPMINGLQHAYGQMWLANS